VAVHCRPVQTLTIPSHACHNMPPMLECGSSVGVFCTYPFTNVTGNHTIAASFTLKAYTLTASAGANGSISPSGATSVNCGSDQRSEERRVGRERGTQVAPDGGTNAQVRKSAWGESVRNSR